MATNTDVLNIFQCPVCLMYMRPPIRMCCRGHSFCGNCAKRVRTCPQCRDGMGVARNFALEHLHEVTVFPCNHHSEGCQFQGKGTLALEHERTCNFQEFPCPLKHIQNCLWTGKRPDMISHCLENHAANSSSFSRQTFVCPNFWQECFEPEGEEVTYSVVLKAYDTVFICEILIDFENVVTEWRVRFLGPSSDSLKYRYSIKVRNMPGDQEPSELYGWCVPWDETDTEFDVINLRGMIRLLKSGQMYYTITVYPKSKMEKGTLVIFTDNTVKEPLMLTERHF